MAALQSKRAKQEQNLESGFKTDPVYNHEMKRVYKEIDKFSNLLAPLREDSELIWNTSRRSKRNANSNTAGAPAETNPAGSSAARSPKKSAQNGRTASATGEKANANWQEETNA